MDYSEHNGNRPKIFKYTDENGNVHYVDEHGNPVRRKRTSSGDSNSSRRSPHSSGSSGSSGSSSSASNRRRLPEDRHRSSTPAVHTRSASDSYAKKRKSNKKKKKKRKGLRIFLAVLAVIILAVIGLCIGVWISIVKDAPKLNTSDIVPSNYTSIIYDDNGVEIDKLHGEENREYVTLDQIPEDLQHAVVAIEDERFYEHNGIDIQGIFRALIIDIKERNFSQGASTITQQLIKNEMLTSDKKITRKIQEQYLAVKYEDELEKTLGSKKAAKDYILELYLNTIGLNHGLNGVGAAAEYYFGKEVSELDLAECACIAGITKNPSKYSPISNPEANKERQTLVLDKMLELGYITQEEHDSVR